MSTRRVKLPEELTTKPIRTEYNIPCPFSRHYQRYEYISKRGLVAGKTVLDVGCGKGIGTMILSEYAKHVTGIDPMLAEFKDKAFVYLSTDARNIKYGDINLFDVEGEHFDVAVAVEVFEHQEDVDRFLAKIAQIADYAFFTTPLADTTAKTRNPDHVYEYSPKDFQDWLSRHFDILDMAYQTGDMRIRNYGVCEGDSFEEWHTVQMAWCRSKR